MLVESWFPSLSNCSQWVLKMPMIGNLRKAKRMSPLAWRPAWLAALAVLAIILQISPAAACHEGWSDLQIALHPAEYLFCKNVFGHFDSSGTGEEQPKPQGPGGFDAVLPDDSARAGLPNAGETRCFPKPVCRSGYRTFCVNPVGASPACCHAWRICEKRI